MVVGPPSGAFELTFGSSWPPPAWACLGRGAGAAAHDDGLSVVRGVRVGSQWWWRW